MVKTQQFLELFDRVCEAPDAVGRLRKFILDLAVRGKLVEQDSKDEPARVLLERIGESRIAWLDDGKRNAEEASTQKRKQAQQVLPDGLCDLPPGWAWATLMQCCALVVDCHNKTAPYSRTGTILVRTTNIRNGVVDLSATKFVDEETYARWSSRNGLGVQHRTNPRP